MAYVFKSVTLMDNVQQGALFKEIHFLFKESILALNVSQREYNKEYFDALSNEIARVWLFFNRQLRNIMAKETKHADKEKEGPQRNQVVKKRSRRENQSINKHAKESGESKHNAIEEDNES